MHIESNRERDCRVLRFASPPVNALGRALAQELTRHVRMAGQEAGIRAIVLVGSGRCFCAGADIAELGADDPQAAAIRTLLDTLDASAVPVIAAIHGVAFGGGLELALACHARVAARGARFAFPEITLGLLPGAGGTQRAPRLIGTRTALALMTSGQPIDATEALAIGLVDQLVDDALEAAVQYGASLDRAPARTRDRRTPDPGSAEAIEAARHAAAARRDARATAAGYIVDCVEAASTRPFEAGLALESRRFDELLHSPVSRGLRHVFLSERRAAKVLDPNGAGATLPVARVAVVGAGLMGCGIATALLAAGLPVALTDTNQDALARARTRILGTFRRDAEKGRIPPGGVDDRMAKLDLSTDLQAAVSPADLVIEAVFEDLDVKREVFASLDRASRPEAILATNTSTLDVDAIARSVRDPGRVVGLHFFSPAHIMRLVEVIRGARTRPEVLATAMAFTRRIGKTGVVAGVCDGFIGNRMFEELLRQAYFLLEEGALPQQVDAAMEGFGFAMGPLRVMDLAGNDIGWSIRRRRAVEQPDRPYSRIPDKLCELGRYGQKTGAGFYLYPDGRKAVVDPQVETLIVAHAAQIGLKRRAINDDEIVARCVLALVNEGARILEEGIALRAADIDVVWTAGYGFPAWRGGPMFHADALGLGAVLDRVEQFSHGHQGWAWRPANLLKELVRNERTFGDLND